MKINFKCPVYFDGQDYKAGLQELADGLASHPYVLALIANNKAKVVEDAKKAPKEEPKILDKSVAPEIIMRAPVLEEPVAETPIVEEILGPKKRGKKKKA